MRILFLLTQDLESPSGLGRYGPMAAALAKVGHQVRVLALHSDFDSLEKKHEIVSGVEVEYVAPMHVRKKGSVKSYYSQPRLIVLMLRATVALIWGALRWPADIVHVCKPHPMNGIAGVIAHWLKRGQLFVDCDDFEPGTNRYNGGWQRQIVQFFERWVSRQANWVTTNTHFTESRLIEFGVPAGRIVYLPNGIDPARFAPPRREVLDGLRETLGLTGLPVVVYVGTISRLSHNIPLLLQAFRLVHVQNPQAVLLLVGGGEDFESLKEEAAGLGLGAAVRFAGRVPSGEVVNFFSLGSVAVDPVVDDDVARGRSPLKLFEAWACGIPFVTADVGDRKSLAGDPPALLLAASGDPASLAKEILRVIANPELAGELSRLGLEKAASFEWDHLAKALEATYARSLQSRQADGIA